MPTRSAKQERFMQAVAHDPKFAKKAGVPQSVGKEFVGMAGGGGIPKVEKGLRDAGVGDGTTADSAAPAPAQPNMRFTNGRPPANTEQRDKLLKSRGFAAGGSIDGCAQRGKTRAKRS